MHPTYWQLCFHATFAIFPHKKPDLSMQTVRKIKLHAWWFAEASIFGMKWTKRTVKTKGYLYQHSWEPVLYRARFCSAHLCIWMYAHASLWVCQDHFHVYRSTIHKTERQQLTCKLARRTRLFVQPPDALKVQWDIFSAVKDIYKWDTRSTFTECHMHRIAMLCNAIHSIHFLS